MVTFQAELKAGLLGRRVHPLAILLRYLAYLSGCLLRSFRGFARAYPLRDCQGHALISYCVQCHSHFVSKMYHVYFLPSRNVAEYLFGSKYLPLVVVVRPGDRWKSKIALILMSSLAW